MIIIEFVKFNLILFYLFVFNLKTIDYDEFIFLLEFLFLLFVVNYTKLKGLNSFTFKVTIQNQLVIFRTQDLGIQYLFSF